MLDRYSTLSCVQPLVFVLRQGLAKLSGLALNLRYSCLNLVGITDLGHFAYLVFQFTGCWVVSICLHFE